MHWGHAVSSDLIHWKELQIALYPKVSCVDGKYYMAVGSGDASSGKVLLFTSDDLLSWDYAGILFEGDEYAHCIECPDYFKMEDKYVLIFSKIREQERATHFVIGDFADGKLVNYTISRPVWGTDFYGPQTFTQGNRRIKIGWIYHWGKKAPVGCPFAGALSIPRELKLSDGIIRNYPVEEARHLLSKESPYVSLNINRLFFRKKVAGESWTCRRLRPYIFWRIQNRSRCF